MLIASEANLHRERVALTQRQAVVCLARNLTGKKDRLPQVVFDLVMGERATRDVDEVGV